MSTRSIRDHLEELFGIEVSPNLISAVTNAVLEEVTEWQTRPLGARYPLVSFERLQFALVVGTPARAQAERMALAALATWTEASRPAAA